MVLGLWDIPVKGFCSHQTLKLDVLRVGLRAKFLLESDTCKTAAVYNAVLTEVCTHDIAVFDDSTDNS